MCNWEGDADLFDGVIQALLANGSCESRTHSPIMASDFLSGPLHCLVSMSAGMNRVIARTLAKSEFIVPPPAPPPSPPNLYLPKLTVGACPRPCVLLRGVCDVSIPPPSAGFVSSDFGIHPVVTLVRGLLTGLDPRRFNVVCYSLHDEESWWSQNISTGVTMFRSAAVWWDTGLASRGCVFICVCMW